MNIDQIIESAIPSNEDCVWKRMAIPWRRDQLKNNIVLFLNENTHMNVDNIVNRAIPQEELPHKEANAKVRREQLKREIERLVEEKKKKPFQPDLQYKEKSFQNGGITGIVEQ